MNPDELDRELERLWARVSPSPVENAALVPPAPWGVETGSPAREASLEAIHLLKRQHREQAARWEEMLGLKEQALRETIERLQRAEAELLGLRRDAKLVEERLRREMYDVASKMEVGRSALEESENRFKSEEAALRGLLDKTREQLAAQTQRWRGLEGQWNEREERYLADLHELQERLGKAGGETEHHRALSRKQADDLQEAKGAIEAALGGLLNERRLREEADKDRADAHQRVVELTERLAQLQKTWDEERRQWQELWDRERSTWEVQRQEFAGWEERLRKEREAWHQELQSKEGEVLRFSAQVSETLRESSETSTKLSQVLKVLSGPPSGVWGPYFSGRAGRWAALAAGILVVAAACYPLWRHLARLRFELVASHALSLDNPTAVAFDGDALWAAEWSGRLVSLDPASPSTVLLRRSVITAGAYHPASIAVGGGCLWTLDAAQGRIVKHGLADPSYMQGAWPTPGPAPVAIAHDGQNLWSYDAVTKTLYRHLGEGPQAELASYRPEVDMVPTSLMWLGGELWVHDSKGRRVLRFKPADGHLRLIDVVKADPGTLSMSVRRVQGGTRPRRTAWVLAAGGRGGAGFFLKKYRVSSAFE